MEASRELEAVLKAKMDETEVIMTGRVLEESIRSYADEIYKIGQALAPLREQQILLIGSGSITHNLRELSWNGDHQNVPEWASTFRNEVVNKLTHSDYDAVLNRNAVTCTCHRKGK